MSRIGQKRGERRADNLTNAEKPQASNKTEEIDVNVNHSLYYSLPAEAEKQTIIPNPLSGGMMRYVERKVGSF